MDFESLKKRIFDEEFNKAKTNCFILNPKEYATDVTNLIVECEGISNCHNHTESFQGVDISNYLKRIKGKNKEHALILAVSNKVEDVIMLCGEKNSIHAKSYFEKNGDSLCALEFISLWHSRGVKICNYHNHPLRIAAIPSDCDINGVHEIGNAKRQEFTEWKECVERYKIDYPVGFVYSDWGVVTLFDFFSYSQFVDKGFGTQELFRYNEDCQIKRQRILSKYDLDS